MAGIRTLRSLLKYFKPHTFNVNTRKVVFPFGALLAASADVDDELASDDMAIDPSRSPPWWLYPIFHITDLESVARTDASINLIQHTYHGDATGHSVDAE